VVIHTICPRHFFRGEKVCPEGRNRFLAFSNSVIFYTYGLACVNLPFAPVEKCRVCFRVQIRCADCISAERLCFCVGTTLLRVVRSAWRAVNVLLFCCRAMVEVFSAAANQKPFVNNDLCTRKSVKTNFKKSESQRFASAWQHQMSGTFSVESEKR